MGLRKYMVLAVALAFVLAIGVGCEKEVEKIVYQTKSPLSHDERFPYVTGSTGPRLISGNIDTAQHLEPDTTYLLRGSVFIQNGASLTIPPGVTVQGENATVGTLIVAQGGKLFCVGTAAKPVLFTSDQTVKAAGQWGGIIMNGYAQINVVDGGGGTAQGEGDTGTYGGDDDHDSSGAIIYTRVEYAGQLYSPSNELNGIALQACGDGTVLDFVQVHANDDDGIEWFGGCANAKHVVITDCEDDSLDWTHGARFMLQFGIVDNRGASDQDRGIEADNYEFGEDNTPRAHPIIANVVFCGEDTADLEAVVLRRGTECEMYNCIFWNFDVALEIDSDSTFVNADSSGVPDQTKLNISYCLWYSCATNCKNHIGSTGATWAGAWDTDYFAPYATMNDQDNSYPYNTETDDDPIYWVTTGRYYSEDVAIGNSPAIGTIYVKDMDSVDSWFDDAPFIGCAVAAYEWYEGWTDHI